MLVLVAYDISNERRLSKVAKIMQDYGVRVQRSIFEVSLRPKTLLVMIKRIKKVIDNDVDGVKFFPLCEKCDKRIEVMGTSEYLEFEEEYKVI